MTVCNWSRRWVASGKDDAALERLVGVYCTPAMHAYDNVGSAGGRGRAAGAARRAGQPAAGRRPDVRRGAVRPRGAPPRGPARACAKGAGRSALRQRAAGLMQARVSRARRVPLRAWARVVCRPLRAGLGASCGALSREGRAGGRARGRLQRRGRAGRPHAVVRPPAASVLERGAACAGRRLRAFRQCRQTATAFHGVCAQCLYKPRDFFILEHPWFLLPCVLVCYPARTLLSEY